jgi:SAM-dependent methyltransferase
MKISRNAALLILHVLDQWLPPAVRDNRLLWRLIFRVVFRQEAALMLDFKEKALLLTPGEIKDIYRRITPYNIQRPTDLNTESIAEIFARIVGPTVLEVGCGQGFLSAQMREHYAVTATEIHVHTELKNACRGVTLLEAFAEALPFADAAFDTVICTHVLEHVLDLGAAVAELRRLYKKRLIVVVPQQRPYKFTFDLHLHFFPYPHSFLLAVGKTAAQQQCFSAGGDLFYVEERRP